jgi:hypothetical protein
LLQSVKLIGKFLLLSGLITTIVGCNPLSNKSKLNIVNENTTLDKKPAILDISTAVIWDGEQTLGGNWISHPNVDSPERVLIKNISNGRSIVGAIFQQTKKAKTETAVISSDAARALDIGQNKQTKVQIIAVREAKSTSPTSNTVKPPKTDSATTETKLSKPFIQVGIFGIENNANKTKDQMLQLNLPANIFNSQIKKKPYWRVVVGPATASESRNNMLKKIKSAGFADAYFVTN